jgi:phosphatidylglycerophosphatase C
LRAAYGDTSGDREMLAIADEPGYRVFQEKP